MSVTIATCIPSIMGTETSWSLRLDSQFGKNSKYYIQWYVGSKNTVENRGSHSRSTSDYMWECVAKCTRHTCTHINACMWSHTLFIYITINVPILYTL